MFEVLRKLTALFPARERRQVYLILPAIIAMAVLQVAGISSVMPFLAVVADPSIIEKNRWLSWAYNTFEFEGRAGFLFMLGCLSFGILLCANAVSALVTWWMVRFAEMRTHYLAATLLEQHLNRPYVFFLGRNSAELSVRVLSEVVQIVTGILLPALQIFAQSAMALLLLAFLFKLDPMLSLIVFVGLGGIYLAIYWVVRGRLRTVGTVKAEANAAQFRALSEASGAIKEIKLLNLERIFLERFKGPNLRMAKAVGTQSVLSLIPNYTMETIAFGGLLGVVLYMLAAEQNLAQVLPLLGLYGYAILRIRPAFQVAYSSVSQIRFNEPVLNRVYSELNHGHASQDDRAPTQVTAVRTGTNGIDLRHSIQLREIWFQFPGSGQPLFENLSLTIPANCSVAFVGPTGSGKTSLVDIILGLLEPDRGHLLVDDTPITAGNRRRWQQNLSYVPQHIYLSDESILSNIAFGVDREMIDEEAVRRAARMAGIDDFISGHLPDGYQTQAGERGVRLSGGQRQRIGIARALYRDAPVMILDEATSALDGITEDMVFESVRELSQTKTIIIIAHRLSTVRDCDIIYMVDHGSIAASGTFSELMAGSDQFRAMAQISMRTANVAG